MALPAAGNRNIHRIGGASLANLRLKPREATLNPSGISVIKAPTPAAAAQEIRTGLPKAKNLHEQAKTIGSASEEAIPAAGFDVILTPRQPFPIITGSSIRKAWQASTTRISLGLLIAEVFVNSAGH